MRGSFPLQSPPCYADMVAIVAAYLSRYPTAPPGSVSQMLMACPGIPPPRKNVELECKIRNNKDAFHNFAPKRQRLARACFPEETMVSLISSLDCFELHAREIVMPSGTEDAQKGKAQ